MTIATNPRQATRQYGPLPEFRNVLRSEFHKLRTVRSTYWTLAAVVASNVGAAALLAAFVSGRLSAGDAAKVDPIQLTLGGMHLAQIAIGSLGVLVVTGEYSTGLIRATLAAVPQRRLVLAAKAFVLAGVALVVGTASSVGAYFVFQALRHGDSMKAALGDPGVLRAVLGGGLYLAALVLFGLGVGAVVRSPAGGIATLMGTLFVPPLLLNLTPRTWSAHVVPYVPMNAGEAVFIASRRDASTLAPWTGFGVFCLYAAVALAAAFFLIDRRDA
jgi:ABC-2 type transport system permease protein